MNEESHDEVYAAIQGTIDRYLHAVEAGTLGEQRKECLEQVMFLIKDWDDYCAGFGIVGQPLSMNLKGRRGEPVVIPKPEPVRNLRREAILAQRARKTS